MICKKELAENNNYRIQYRYVVYVNLKLLRNIDEVLMKQIKKSKRFTWVRVLTNQSDPGLQEGRSLLAHFVI
jgi:hypothetical protein